MGDAADDAYDRAMDELEHPEWETEDEFDGSPRPAPRPRCKTCGATNVMWLKVHNRNYHWVLCDNVTGDPHQCPAAQLMENLDA